MTVATLTGTNIQTCARQLLDKYIVTPPEQRPDTPLFQDWVHDTRTGTKRFRSLLRLLKPLLKTKQFKAADLTARNLSNALAHERDAVALLQTLDHLLINDDMETLVQCRDIFVSNLHQQIETPAPDHDRGLQQLVNALKAEPESWKRDEITRACLLNRLERAIQRGRDQWLMILEQLQYEDATRLKLEQVDRNLLHQWRKSVKRSYYQLVLVKPQRLKKTRTRLKEMGELLGRLNDLDNLTQFVSTHSEAFSAEQQTLIKQRVYEQACVLLEQTLLLAARIYRRSPKAIAERAL